MKKSVADKWVKALRSGKYKQTKRLLQDVNGHCCLGVLCEISPTKPLMNSSKFLSGNTLISQERVQNWAELQSSAGNTDDDHSLASLNDEGYTFDEIADIIQLLWREL